MRLDADGHPFLGIHTEADSGGPRRAVIVLHGRGFHPDWPEVAAPLRIELPEHGWETLSLQMPVLGKSAKYYDYVPISPLPFPVYGPASNISAPGRCRPSCSPPIAAASTWRWAYVGEHGDAAFDGFIGIEWGDRLRPAMRGPFPLETMSVPLLDLFGDEDYPAVLKEGPGRLAAIRAAGAPAVRPNASSRAPGHFFRDMDDELVDAVAEWLATLHGDG